MAATVAAAGSKTKAAKNTKAVAAGVKLLKAAKKSKKAASVLGSSAEAVANEGAALDETQDVASHDTRSLENASEGEGDAESVASTLPEIDDLAGESLSKTPQDSLATPAQATGPMASKEAASPQEGPAAVAVTGGEPVSGNVPGKGESP